MCRLELYEAKQQTGSAVTLTVARLKVIFKDTSWTEILHVKADFHSTLCGWTVFPCKMEKSKVGMFGFRWRTPKFNEGKGLFLCQNINFSIIVRRRLKGINKRNLKNKKITVTRYFLPSSFYPLEVAFLNIC